MSHYHCGLAFVGERKTEGRGRERDKERFVGRRNLFLVQDEAITQDETLLHDDAGE
jgi:hypothetical protein